MSRRILAGTICLALLACLVGCPGGDDGDHPQTVPVTGTVTYKDSAVDGARVTFSPASGSGYAAIGSTDPQGNFTLRCPQWGTEGAVPGSYTVLVSKTEVEGGEADPEEAGPDGGAPTKVTEHLPRRYKSAETSDLSAEVKAEGENHFPLELTD